MNDFKMPSFKPPTIDNSHKYAIGYVERIQEKMSLFIEEVPNAKKPLIYVLLSDGDKIFNLDLGYHNPYMIIVNGTDKNGNDVKALIHQNNIQVVMKYIKE